MPIYIIDLSKRPRLSVYIPTRVSLEFSLSAKVHEPFNIAIPASKILSVCSSLKEETLKFSLDGSKVEIRTEFGEYSIMGQNADEFPAETVLTKSNKISFSSEKIKKLIVITRGEKGALAIKNEKVVECPAKKNLKVVDLTGAGDLFAGGFLDGFIKRKSIEESLERGTEMSSKIIQIIGAR